MHGACDIIFYFLTIVYSLTIVAFSCSGRGLDFNRDASSVSFPRHSLYFYCISIV